MTTTARAAAPEAAEKLTLAAPDLRSIITDLTKGTYEPLAGVKLSQGEIASRIGRTSPVISSWLKGQYRGDVVDLERRLSDLIPWLIHESHRPRTSTEIFETVITQRVAKALTTTKRQGFIGCIVGTPGLGKSSGIDLYLRANALDVGIRLNAALHPGCKGGIIAAFWASPNFSRTGYKRSGLTKSAFLCQYFKGQKRLIIVDNAHTLSRGGLDWLVGFHEATGCPIALVGNVELLDTILKVERAPTHIGLKSMAEFDDTSAGKKAFESFAEETALAFTRLHWPNDEEIVRPLAHRILQTSRNVRSLRNVSTLAANLIAAKPSTKPAEAFAQAKTRQIHDYQLAM